MKERITHAIKSKGLILFFLYIFLSMNAAAQTIRILPLGNSITWGKANRAAPVPGEHGYRDHLLDLLGNYDIEMTGPTAGDWAAQFLTPDPPYLGYYIDGAKIDEFLPDSGAYDVKHMLDDLDVDDLPDFVTLHIGSNDIFSQQPVMDHETPGSIMYDLKTLLDVLLGYERGGHTIEKIFLCKIIPASPYEDFPNNNQKIIDYNYRISLMWQDLGADQDRVRIVDMFNPFYSNQFLYYNTDVDNIHPNHEGYEAMAKIFADNIKSYLGSIFVDQFDRPGIGPDSLLNGSNEWFASDSIKFHNVGENGGGVIYCDVVNWDWMNLAIWDSTLGLNTATMAFHDSSVHDAEFLSGIGLAVGLSSNDNNNASGYMVFVRNKKLYVSRIIDGKVTGDAIYTNKINSNYSPGSVLKVSYIMMDFQNRFYISFKGTEYLFDDNSLDREKEKNFYSGIMFRGGSGDAKTGDAAMINYFRAENLFKDIGAPPQITTLTVLAATNNSVTLEWQAVDDGDEGRASSYDLRYAIYPIDATNFDNAIIAPNVPTPKEPNEYENVTINGLLAGVKYYFAVKAVDHWGFMGNVSNIVSASTIKVKETVDNFDRETLGESWVYNTTEYYINQVFDEAYNSGNDSNWGSAVIYTGRVNPTTVKMVWGHAVTNIGDPDIENGGLILMADDNTVNANAYFILIRTKGRQKKQIYLFDIQNGQVDSLLDAIPYELKNYPASGDTLAVVMDNSVSSYNRFVVYVNSKPASRLSLYDTRAAAARHGNEENNYAGFLLSRIYNIRNNYVAAYITTGERGNPSEIRALGSQVFQGIVNDHIRDTQDNIDSLRIEVLDENNLPLENVPLFFDISGGGKVGAPQVPDGNILIEAEWGILDAPMIEVESGDASGGGYIFATESGDRLGSATYQFYVDTSATYYFWARAQSTVPTNYLCFFELIGKTSVGGFFWNVLEQEGGSSWWQWDQVQDKESPVGFSAPLTKGFHTIIIHSGHDRVKIDKILITRLTPSLSDLADLAALGSFATDINGRAVTTWTLGPKANDPTTPYVNEGLNTIVVNALGTTDTLHYTAYATHADPDSIEKVNDNQSGTGGKQLSLPLIAIIRDAYGNRVPDVDVQFEIVRGRGAEITFPNVTADPNGEASTNMLLGKQDSVYQVKVTFNGYTGPDVLFKALVTEGRVNEINNVTDKEKHYIDDVVPNYLKAKVRDEDRIPVDGVWVVFEVVEGNASVGKIQPKVTDSQGIAQDTLTLGSTASVVKVIARVDGTSIQDTVLVDSIYFKGAKIQMLGGGGDGQSPLVNEQTQDSLIIIVTDKYGDGVEGHPVVFETKDYGFRFPDRSTRLELKTDNMGRAWTYVVAGPQHGYYEDIVWVSSNDGFNSLTGSPVKFLIAARSTVSQLLKTSGDSLVGVVGEILDVPLIIKMVDKDGKPVGNQPVDFEIKGGGGHFESYDLPIKRVITDDQTGEAYIYFYLGPEVGLYNNIIKASTMNVTKEIETWFHISAKSSRADSIVAVSDKVLTGIVGKELSQPVQVKVTDNFGNLIAGENVVFSVIGGGGSLNSSANTTKTVVTDSTTKIASVNWTLGTKTGTNNNVLKVVSFNGVDTLKGSPINFVASANPDSVSGSTSIIEADNPVSTHKDSVCEITVILRDDYGNPVPGKLVELVVTGGSENYIQNPTKLTDNSGKAYGELKSPEAGEKLIQAVVDNDTLATDTTVVFTATVAKKIECCSGMDQVGNVGTVLKDPLVVQVTDENGNPVEYGPVEFIAFAGGAIVDKQPYSDSLGLVQARFLLGNEVRVYAVEVKSTGLSTAFFGATARNEGPVSMDYPDTSYNFEVEGMAGEVLPEPFVVKIMDKDGLAVAGVSVEFIKKTDGSDGVIETDQPSISDMYGHASALFRMNTEMGTETEINAVNENLSNSPRRFMAKSIAGIARKILPNSATEIESDIGKRIKLEVKVTDNYGNVKSNVPVSFEVMKGEASIETNNTVNTNSSGIASASIALSNTIGTVKVWAINPILEGSPLEFVIDVKALNATGIIRYPVSDDIIIGTVNNMLVDSLRVMVIDDYGNPVSGTNILFELRTGDEGSIISETDKGNNVLVKSKDNGIASVAFETGLKTGLSMVTARSTKTVSFPIQVVNNPNFPRIKYKHLFKSNYDEEEKKSIELGVWAYPDGDGDTLSFQIGNLFPPRGATFVKTTDTTATFEWIPDYDQQGIYNIILRVVDGRGGSDEVKVKITVKNTNKLPQIVRVSPSGDTTATSGEKVTFWVDARDIDWDPIYYFWMVDGKMVGENLPVYYHSTEKSFSGKQIVKVFVSDMPLGVTDPDSGSFQWELYVTKDVTAVELSKFAAQFDAEKTHVHIWWITSRELGNSGFDIYRGMSEEGAYIKINEEIIPNQKGGEYRFIDETVEAGRTYYYKLVAVDDNGKQKEQGLRKVKIPLPREFDLAQNYPNPFNPITTIQYQVPERNKINLTIYNMMGQKVVTLVEREQNPGYYTAEWDGKNESGQDVSTGIYIYRLKNEKQTLTRKMVKIR